MAKPMIVEKWQAKSRWVEPGEIVPRIGELEVQISKARDYRERQQHARALAFCCTSAAVSDVDFSADDLARIIAACLFAKRSGGATELIERTLMHLMRRRLDVIGVGDPVMIAEAKKRVTWEGGCVAVATNGPLARHTMQQSECNIVDAMNTGAFYMVNLGGDGTAPLTLRIVDFAEPMLAAREFAKTEAVSGIGWINVEDGALLAGAAEDLEHGARLPVLPGRYLTRLFKIGPRLVFVATRSDAPVHPLQTLPSIQ